MKQRFNPEDRFTPQEPDMEAELNEIMINLMDTMSKYVSLQTSDLDELKAEQAKWLIKKDGKHLYVGKKSVKDPKELSILETAIYTRKINRLSLAAKIHIFSAEEPDDDKSAREMRAYFKSRGFDEESAMQYLDAYIAMGKDEEEAVQCVNDSAEQIRSDPDKYAPHPEKATDYLAACVETLRQIVDNHRFTKEQFKELYKPLEKLALRLTLFEPGFTEEEREGLTREEWIETVILTKEARKAHEGVCVMFGAYRILAQEILYNQ